MCTHSCISLNRLEFLLKCSHWSICTHKIRYVRIFGWYTSVTKPPQCQTLDISLGYKHGKPESRSAVNITSQRSPRFGSFRVPQILRTALEQRDRVNNVTWGPAGQVWCCSSYRSKIYSHIPTICRLLLLTENMKGYILFSSLVCVTNLCMSFLYFAFFKAHPSSHWPSML